MMTLATSNTIERSERVMEKDAFAGSMFTGTFERNADGQVIGFSLDAGRVKNMKFTRKTH